MEVVMVYPAKINFGDLTFETKCRENRQQTTFGLTCSVSIIQLLGSKALDFPGSSGAGDVVVVLAI